MAKRAVGSPANRSVVGQERDAAVRDGLLREPDALAFANRHRAAIGFLVRTCGPEIRSAIRPNRPKREVVVVGDPQGLRQPVAERLHLDSFWHRSKSSAQSVEHLVPLHASAMTDVEPDIAMAQNAHDDFQVFASLVSRNGIRALGEAGFSVEQKVGEGIAIGARRAGLNHRRCRRFRRRG
jgi:hypothetical protein